MGILSGFLRRLRFGTVEPANDENPKATPIDEAIRNIHFDREQVAKRIDELHAPKLKLDELLKLKTSDTLFILGSGPSINQLSNDDWKTISLHNSIGFNFFMAHDFVPTYYHMELVPSNIDFVRSIYSMKNELFQQTPFLVNGFYIEQGRTANDYSFGRYPAVFAPSFPYYPPPQLKQILTRFAAENTSVPHLFHYRGSLTISLSLAAALNYRKVILVGIDLDTPDYFFFDEQLYTSEVATQIRFHCLERQEKQRALGRLGTMHRTIDKLIEPQTLTIDEFIDVFNSHFLAPLRIDLGVASTKSALARVLPVRPISWFQ
jgi:hypothetical protein